MDEIAIAARVPYAVVESTWPYLGQELINWGFASPLSCIGAIGTAAHESSFYPREEADYLGDRAAMNRWYADTTRHAPYQGGIKYHGYGLIQTTHLNNFIAVEEMMARRYGINIDLVEHPELLLNIEYAAPAFCQYWNTRNLVGWSEAQNWAQVRVGVFGGADPVGTERIQTVANKLIPLAQQRGYM